MTRLLEDTRAGDPSAREELFRRVYHELMQLARSRLGRVEPLTCLDAPGLVHEAYVRLCEQQTGLPGGNRRMFYAYASGVMRSVVIDHLRERGAAKRGGQDARVALSTHDPELAPDTPDFEALDAALRQLAEIDERAHQIVELRYFGGLSLEDIAEVLGLSRATVKRDWQKARAFLFKALND